MEAENLAEFYYEKLHDTTNPALVLSQFYGNLFSREYSRSEIIMFNRLLKLYGRFTIYFCLLDMHSMAEINFEKVYGLISYFAKKRLEQKYGVLAFSYKSLDREVVSIEKMIEKQKKLKLKVRELDE